MQEIQKKETSVKETGKIIEKKKQKKRPEKKRNVKNDGNRGVGCGNGRKRTESTKKVMVSEAEEKGV